jgi:dipeptidyl aminopeptidase/acylaminoacyl peptidase
MTPLFFAGDNKKIYALSNINRDKQAFIIFNPDEIKEEDVLFERSDVDIKNAVMSQKRKVLTSVVYITDKTYRFYFDENTRCLYKYLFKHIVNQKINITSMNKSETKFIVFASSDCNIGTYYLYDFIADKIIKLGNIAPWINPEHLASMKSIQYTSRDGHTINGYLTLPKVRESNNLPVIVYPHGGPWGRDYWCYNSIVQFLANRGYAVLQMNFRGSTGYGKAFLNAGDKQWGRKMQDDITDGVQWLITRGIANPERIAIYGSSYGGYAVLAGLTFTSDIYACGVDFAGPSNLFTLLESFPPYWKTELLEIYERIGHPEKDKQFLKEISPVFHVEKIKAPLLVIQGANDPRVSINESNQIVNALCARSIPVEYMVKKNEGHDFRNEENRIDLYKTIEKFLAKYLN